MLYQTWRKWGGRGRARERGKGGEKGKWKCGRKGKGRDEKMREEREKECTVANYQGKLAVDAGTYFSTSPSFRCSKMS